MKYLTHNTLYTEIEKDLNAHANQGWVLHTILQLSNGTWEMIFCRNS